MTQAQSAAKLRARQESDLQLQVAEVARRRRDFEKLYDLVRLLLLLLLVVTYYSVVVVWLRGRFS